MIYLREMYCNFIQFNLMFTIEVVIMMMKVVKCDWYCFINERNGANYNASKCI